MLRVAVICVVLGVALGHVRMRGPPSRSSIWRDPAFSHLKPPVNYDDDGYNCGYEPQYEVVQNCGVCGDAASDPKPRPNENGGTYGKGIIVANYKPGQVVPVQIEFTTTHTGYLEVHLCDRVPETDDCFKTLQFGDGKTQIPVPEDGQSVWINTTLQIPSDVRCEQCVVRLHYRAGNGWGDCGDGTEGMGCGLQETFRNCADISIQ